ncbi:hypothetical protein LOZ65_006213 [Ophidiomyces ophidiicola]|nr:hypothetical protein LOZ65_006213 [Ophidiomyces ophidiicola]
MAPQSWHGQRKAPENRLPRYCSKSPHAVSKKHIYRRSPPLWRRKWDSWRPNRLSDRHTRLEPLFSSLSVKDRSSGSDKSQYSLEKPPLLAPNAREQSCFEITNGAFDIHRNAPSPKNYDDLKAVGSFEIVSSDSDPQVVPLVSPFGKQINPTPVTSSFGRPTPLCHSSSRRHCLRTFREMGTPSPAVFSTSSKPAAFGSQLEPVLDEMATLLQLIQQNPGRSKELLRVVSKHLHEHPKKQQENKKWLSHRLQQHLSPVAPLVATIPGGGDSPPHGPFDAFRGHMVDRPCINTVALSSCASGMTTRSVSAIPEIIQPDPAAPQMPQTPVLKPRSLADDDDDDDKTISGPSRLSDRMSELNLSSQEDSADTSPCCPGVGHSCDHWLASYYDTLATLSPSTLSPEDWQAIHAVFPHSPKSVQSMDLNEESSWPHSNGDSGHNTDHIESTAMHSGDNRAFQEQNNGKGDSGTITPASGHVHSPATKPYNHHLAYQFLS